MNARNSWSAKKDRKGSELSGDHDPDMPFDELLDARFDEQGRLAQLGRGSRQRTADRLDPRPPAMSPEELERAVQKLAQGLEAIERQSSTQGATDAGAAATAGGAEAEAGGARDFVTYSLDRLEARLEALSKRLQQRAAAGENAEQPSGTAATERATQPARAAGAPDARTTPPRGDPSFAVESRPEIEARGATARRNEAARALREAEAAAEQRRRAEALEAQRRAEAAEAERRAEAEEAAEATRRAEAAEAERRAMNVAAGLRRHFAQLEARIDELQKSADQNQIEPVRHELMELLRQIEDLKRNGQSVAGSVDHVRVRLDDVETKVAAARNLAGNRIGDLQDRLSGLSERLDEFEVEVPGFDAVRENQSAILERFDRMEGLVTRLSPPQEIIERVEVLRRQLQTVASQQEVVRIEEHINQLADRLDALPGEISDAAVLERMDAQLRSVASELSEARRHRETGTAELNHRLAELAAGLKEIADADHSTDMTGVEARLSDISSRIDDSRRFSADRLAHVDRQLVALAAAMEVEEDDASAEILAALTRRMEALAEAIEAQDARGARRDLEGLDRKLDQLASALEDQADRLARPQLEPLEDRLEQMQRHLEEVARRSQHSTAQFGPFSQKLQEIAERLNSLGASGDDQGALVARLASIEERLAGLAGRGPEARALHTQLESIVSRLELLKGRSIDPARLGEMFDRVDAAIRAGSADERLQRIEKKIESAGVPAERFDRLERKLEQSAVPVAHFDRLEKKIEQAAVPAERFERLERRIEQSAVPAARFDELARKIEQSAFPAERLERLERTIAETVRAGIGDERYEVLESRIAENALAGIAEQRFARLEQLLLDETRAGPAEDRLARIEELLLDETRAGPAEERLARIEQLLERGGDQSGFDDERFARLERKLEEVGRAFGVTGGVTGGEGVTQEDVADLSTDIVALRRELRSLPGLGEGEGNLGAVLKTIAARLERLPDEPPATAPELEMQVNRIAQLLDDPSHSRLALAHIESSLKSIEQRLEDTRRTLLYRAPETPEPDGGEQFETVAGLARALSDDVTVLKTATEVSERKTKDALEAVQDTLQAVVKRMAFLERDADLVASSAEERLPEPSRVPPPPVVPAMVPESERQPNAPPLSAVIADRQEPQREPSGGGLFSRFTSSQLMRRATGGRAESFSPDHDEIDELADLPLEPGTDSPLDSALTGAPSSDTALMSGARKGRLSASSRGRDQDYAVRYPAGDPETSDDFLAAARRAAQAATDETDGVPAAAGGMTPSTRRRTILGAVLAVAVAFAAFQIVRNLMATDESRLVELPTPPASEQPQPAPQPNVNVVVVPEPEASTETPPPQATAATEDTAPETEASSPPIETGFTPAEGAMAARGPDTPGAPAEEEIAALAPTTDPAPLENLPEPVAPADVGGLPPELGPTGLRQAAVDGNPAAAFEVAARYAEGRGVMQDMDAAVEWYKRAADAGLAPAQYRLGSIFEKGLGVPQDLAAAQDWYSRASEAGNVKAMHNLAVLYAEGAGGEPDLERSAELFRQAAEHGVRDSQFNLAILHARGLGVRQDMVEAYRWFAIAASSGDAESAKRRDIIAAALAPDDLAAAQAAAAEFQPQPLIAEANDVMMPEGGWGDDSTSVELDSTTDVVALVQLLLAEQGFDPGPADGLLGRQTIQAITAFQEDAGLPTTGEIDAGLVAALQAPST